MRMSAGRPPVPNSKLPQRDGCGVLRAATDLDPSALVVMTGMASIQDAVTAMRKAR